MRVSCTAVKSFFYWFLWRFGDLLSAILVCGYCVYLNSLVLRWLQSPSWHSLAAPGAVSSSVFVLELNRRKDHPWVHRFEHVVQGEKAH